MIAKMPKKSRNWDVDQIQPQLSSVADREVRDAIKKLSGRFALGGS